MHGKGTEKENKKNGVIQASFFYKVKAKNATNKN